MRIRARLQGDNVLAAIRQARKICEAMLTTVPVSPGDYPDLDDFEFYGDGLSNITLGFSSNRITILVRADSDPDVVYRDYTLAQAGEIAGPYPHVTSAVQRYVRSADAVSHRDQILVRAALAPPLKARVCGSWRAYELAALVNAGDRADDPDVKVYAYTDRWARLMQIELDSGASLESIWERTSHEADVNNDMSALRRRPVQLLAEHWLYGRELLRLYNRAYPNAPVPVPA